MKKTILIALAACGLMTAQAQKAYETPGFFDNWSVGVDGGLTTPISNHAFFGDMRGAFGLHLQKQVTPVIAIGFEGIAGVNTSSWNQKNFQALYADYMMAGRSSTAIDNMYLGLYASADLFNLFGGYKADRLFTTEAVVGVGYGHDFYDSNAFFPMSLTSADQNYFATKVGLNFNFNINKNWTIALKPSVTFNMTGSEYLPLDVAQTSVAYNSTKAAFNLLAGVSYNFGPGFQAVETKDQAEIDALNAKINALRGELDACAATTAANVANVKALQKELDACKNRKIEPVIVEKVSDNLQSIRYIFYAVGSSKITADQKPNVEMVAKYLENNKNAKVVIKGYASPEGNVELNKKLAAARAESVKEMLIKKYGIAADRITAQGEGIGNMFAENDWNRVSICTLED